MEINTDQLTKDILEHFRLIEEADIPNISLYMDQVTTFMDKHLSYSKRYEDDKILTKTMINNYAKNNLIPPPEKKRYTKEHVIVLTFIYYFKNIMSINDIKTVLTQITDRYFASHTDLDLSAVYEEISRLQQADLHSTQQDIASKAKLARESFASEDADDQEFLQLFSLICMLSFDVYVKKQLIESIVDQISQAKTPSSRKDAAKARSKDKSPHKKGKEEAPTQ